MIYLFFTFLDVMETQLVMCTLYKKISAKMALLHYRMVIFLLTCLLLKFNNLQSSEREKLKLSLQKLRTIPRWKPVWKFSLASASKMGGSW